ncbi:MAG: (d)CMP kinase [Chloroflexota bacterium]|nr:MAG: (d)CMP kinase [Chloroflexota bacterium]
MLAVGRTTLISDKFIEAIAIDGPAASGKTTVGQMLADRLGFLLLDTGCMYRAVTWAVLREGISPANESAVVTLATSIRLDIEPPGNTDDGRLYTVLLDDHDITWQIRSSEVDVNVSQVSAYRGVRRELVKRQRDIAERGRVVVVGRDIGTVVLPDAPLKLYIIASPEERARRRWTETEERTGDASYERILDDMTRRDQYDGQREHSPMRPADDSIIIDTTDRQPESVVSSVLAQDYFKESETTNQRRFTRKMIGATRQAAR